MIAPNFAKSNGWLAVGHSGCKFSVEATGLHLQRLPESWQVPAVAGRVSGKAELEVVCRAGRRTAVRGGGEGSVQMLAFLPPIRLRLEATERGFRFVPAR